MSRQKETQEIASELMNDVGLSKVSERHKCVDTA